MISIVYLLIIWCLGSAVMGFISFDEEGDHWDLLKQWAFVLFWPAYVLIIIIFYILQIIKYWYHDRRSRT